MNVPFLDLKSQYLSIKSEIQAALDGVIEKTAFAGGPFVAQFEKEFAQILRYEARHRSGKRHRGALDQPRCSRCGPR